MTVRIATPDDAAAVVDVYRPYVEETAITSEETPPDVPEMRGRIAETLERHPWLVAERDGTVAGYAFAGRLRKRQAYRWSAELSVYVDRERRGEGIGRELYGALLAVLERQGFRNGYAVVTLPNPGSAAFHESLGFERVGTVPAASYKLGEWHDDAWYVIELAERTVDPDPPTPFAAVEDEELSAVLDAESR